MATLIANRARAGVRRLVKTERGAEVVEMAVVLPLLVLVTMGIVDFGLMFQRYAVLTNAAMEGARVGTLPGYQIPEDVDARVLAYATSGGVHPSSIVIEAIPTTVPAAGAGTYPAVQVTVTHNYTLDYIGPIAAIFGGNSSRTVTLRARSIMRSQVAAGGE